MDFDLKAHFELSGNLPKEALKDLENWVENLNDDLSFEGEQEGRGAKIEKFELKNKVLRLNITSGGGRRAHAALMTVRNYLSQKIGKKHKVGFRGTKIEDYQIKMEVEKRPKEEFEIPFAELKFNGKEVTIQVDPEIDIDLVEKGAIDRMLNLVEEKIRKQYISGKKEFTETIKEGQKRIGDYKFREDPTDLLEEKHWVKKLGRGIWTVLPPMAALMRAIEKLVIDEILKPMDFKEVYLPKIVPLEVQRKKGQLGGIPNQMWWVCPPISRNPETFEEYSDYVKVTGKTAPKKLEEFLGNPKHTLAYAQCEPFYDIWTEGILNRDKMPVKLFDRNGPTYRYEAGGLKGLERLNEFQRTEMVFLGTPGQVMEIRNKIRDKAMEIIDEIFQLEWRLDKTTAVYLEHMGEHEDEEEDFVKTYDLTAILPFGTKSRPEEEELEIASFHLHSDFYAERFNWEEKKDRELWSGCVGVSPTRWAYVFLLRWGLDYESWPEEIKKYIGEELPTLPEGTFIED